VRLQLDTHTILWWVMDDPRLSDIARRAIREPSNELFASACVAYEIIYKQQSGRLPPLPVSLPRQFHREGVSVLPITLDHAIAAAALPGPHRDPWDRIMMAQAIAEALTVVMVDPVFASYDVPVLW
jgi:PIN domain nuclease of toxin-antitoxin system